MQFPSPDLLPYAVLTALKVNGKYLVLDKKGASTENNEFELQDLPVFNFEELATATNNFSLANKLGEGGFGPVYKVLLA